jgi:S-adenosylmethionine synthetase
VCGRASNPQARLDMPAVVFGAAGRWLDDNLAPGAALFELVSEVREGSASLGEIFKRDTIRANDTSFGVGFAPLSALEAKVLQLAAVLRADALRRALPAAGQDFKVMGLRDGAAMTFTVALAMVDRHVRGLADYFAVKDAVRSRLKASIEASDEVLVNRLDDPHAKDENGLYLTVTGLSAEMGDDGQVGRGNRVNGLITPGRAMSMEAAAGKNPFSHVGKIYNALAHTLAQAICEQIPEVTAATVRILSAIGSPLDEPQAAAVEIHGAVDFTVRERVRGLVDSRFDALAPFLRKLSAGQFPVY